MQLEYIIEKGDKLFNTYNGKEIDLYNVSVATRRLEAKHGIKFFNKNIVDNLFYKYSVEVIGDLVNLIVYEGSYDDQINWNISYIAKITLVKSKMLCN